MGASAWDDSFCLKPNKTQYGGEGTTDTNFSNAAHTCTIWWSRLRALPPRFQWLLSLLYVAGGTEKHNPGE